MTNPVFNKDLGTKVANAKLFMVGAGGIGCELLKNLVLTGFKNITIVSHNFPPHSEFANAATIIKIFVP